MSCVNSTRSKSHSPMSEFPPRAFGPQQRRKRSSGGDRIKILVLGAPQVGRSALIVRFLTQRFIGDYDSSQDHRYRRLVLVDDENVLVEIVDEKTTRPIGIGQEEFVKWADAFVLVYSITDLASYHLVRLFRRRISEAVRRTMALIPVLLVGQKRDLEQFRAVTSHDGEFMAAEYGALFCELSAADDMDRITSSFSDLCREVISMRRRSRTLLNRVFGLAKHKNSY